ncbi:MAG: hypothetical protein P4M04_13550 [Acidobacteriota bacterium]|nr:hypothetical protein [Acidobacteriota bacterium]
MKPTSRAFVLVSITLLISGVAQLAQTAAPPASSKTADALELVKQGQKLNSEGKQDEAIALYERALQMSPNLYQAEMAEGVALDLEGKYAPARQHLSKAVEIATPEQKPGALRTLAVSYAFECNLDKASEYDRQAFDLLYNAAKIEDAAGAANELARIYLECGDADNAFQWYQTGHLTALKLPNLTPAQKDLWEFRWESAMARVRARQGRKEEAQQHLAAAKAILDKGGNPDQARFYPYIAGYVALYGGDYKTALAELQQANQKADQKDAFVLVLLAQAYEKSGDKAKAMDCYKQVLTINNHAPTNAFARPLARKALAGQS